jgi:hypothetical protein
LGEFQAAFETGWSRFGEGTDWRRWDGKDFQVWVVFAKTKEGKRAAFSTALQKTGGGYQRHEGFTTFADANFGHDLDELNADRKKEAAIRNDKKWLHGVQVPALIPGEWRTENADAILFGTEVKFQENNAFTMTSDKQPTYRVIDDKKLEITHPPLFNNLPTPAGQPNLFKSEPVVRKYEYFVNQEELALIEITPHAHHASISLRTFYRMPAVPGGVADKQLIAPLIADIKGTDATKRQVALFRLKRLGKGAPTAVPALTELVRSSDSTTANAAIDTLGDMKEAAAPAVPTLAAQLKSGNSNRVLTVVLALSRIGPAAKDALPALRELAKKTTDGRLKSEVESTIRIIEGKKP